MKKQKLNSGFTVLEAIIAILILSAVIGGVSSAVARSITGLSVAKEEVKAFYLAQEAVEMIRNMRDNNKLDNLVNNTSHNWLAGIADAPGDPCYNTICKLDITNPIFFTACGASWGSCPDLNQDASGSYLYGYNGAWLDSGFKREIQVTPISAREATITVSISWKHGALNREFKTTTVLEDWF